MYFRYTQKQSYIARNHAKYRKPGHKNLEHVGRLYEYVVNQARLFKKDCYSN